MYHISEIGQGVVDSKREEFRLSVPPSTDATYHNAQIASYGSRRDFGYAPPLRMTVRAYVEGDIQGTAGFGFWNHPYGRNLFGLRPPRAVWFFYGSPPNDMPLAKNIAGHGWKCATFDATRWQFFALAPTAPIAFLLMRMPYFYDRLWSIGQRAIGVSEKLLDGALLKTPHDYTLEWRREGVTFAIDGETVFESDLSPKGKLGFVAWVDNQYAIVTPQGRFGSGLVEVPETQALIIERIAIEPLD
jgi:hypothetical protein